MIAVSDSTPMIYLSKLGKLHYLKSLFKNIFITKEVFAEVVLKGKEQNKKEIASIEEAIEEKFIVVKSVMKKINMLNLGEGELTSLSLCKELKIKNLLIDDNEGYAAANLIEVIPIRTTTLLIILLDKKLINFEEYKESLIRLSEKGYFLSAEVYEKLLGVGRNISHL